jgi:hypothetical protein
MFVPWDQDHSFGQFAMAGTQVQREQLSIQKPWRFEPRLLERAFKVEAFKKLYLSKLEEFGRTLFKPERFAGQVDELAAAIREAVKEEGEGKLARFEAAVAGRVPSRGGLSFLLGGGGPDPDAMKPIKPFVTIRSQNVADQLAGKVEGLKFSPQRGFGRGPGVVEFMMPAFLALDLGKSGRVTQAAFVEGMAKWFVAWDVDGDGGLSEGELRAGAERVFVAAAREGGGRR